MKTIINSLLIISIVILSAFNLVAQDIQDFTNLLTNPDFEYSSEDVLNDGTTVRGIPYGWSSEGELLGNSFGINKDGVNYHGNNLCWINSTPMPESYELYQEVSGLPAGEYTVRCRFAVITGAMTNQRLFANNNVQYFGAESDYAQNLTEGENNTFAGYTTKNIFDLQEMALKVDIAEDEKLKLGIRSSNQLGDGTRIDNTNAGWFKVDHFRIEPYTEAPGFISNIVINSDTLDGFDPAVDYYEIEVPYGTTSLSLEAIPAEIGSTVSIYGSSTAVYDENTGILSWEGEGDYVTIDVTLSSGASMKYGIDIFVKDGISDSFLKNLELSAGLMDKEFNYSTFEYNVLVPRGTTTVDVTATPNYPDATVEGAGTINISDGKAEVVIIVTSYDKSTTNTYNVNIVEDKSFTSYLINPDFEFSSEGVLNDGTTVRGIPYGWSSEGELIGESFGINSDGIDYNGNNLCWINSSPMPDEYELYQVVENLPADDYIVQCRLAVMSNTVTNQRLFANNTVQYYGSETDYVSNIVEGEEYSFAEYIPSGVYNLMEMEVKVSIANGEALKLGIRSGNLLSDGTREASTNAGWFKVDHFRILPYGNTSSFDFDKGKELDVRIKNEKNALQIIVDEANSNGNISLYTYTGQLISHNNITGKINQVNVPNQGMYVVRVVVNGQLFTKKIIIR